MLHSRKTYKLLSADYGAIEMCTFAQVMYWMIGPNHLMDAINNGIDPHLELARNFPHLSMHYPDILAIKAQPDHPKYDEIYGPAGSRFVAKSGNFGYAGGMGPKAYRDYARKMSDSLIVLTLDESKMIKDTWMYTWKPHAYFKIVSNITEDPNAVIAQFVSQRLRGGLTYTKCANTFFQGLAADGAKNAMWLITKACFYDRKSPLYGFKPRAFVHDEFLISGPKSQSEAALEELKRLMIAGMQPYTPDIKIKVDGKIADRWTK
jgi:hypothetical protein